MSARNRARRRPAARPRAAQAARIGARNGNGASGNGAAASAPQLADPLIRCAQCGVHTPRSESIVVAGQRFCCADHARHHASRPTGRDAR